MIGLAANLDPFFMRVNPNTAVFTFAYNFDRSPEPRSGAPFQFLSGHCLDHIQDLLGNQAFKLTKRFPLNNRAHLTSFIPFAFFEKQFPDFAEQRYRRTLDLLLEFLLPLDIG